MWSGIHGLDKPDFRTWLPSFDAGRLDVAYTLYAIIPTPNVQEEVKPVYYGRTRAKAGEVVGISWPEGSLGRLLDAQLDEYFYQRAMNGFHLRVGKVHQVAEESPFPAVVTTSDQDADIVLAALMRDGRGEGITIGVMPKARLAAISVVSEGEGDAPPFSPRFIGDWWCSQAVREYGRTLGADAARVKNVQSAHAAWREKDLPSRLEQLATHLEKQSGREDRAKNIAQRDPEGVGFHPANAINENPKWRWWVSLWIEKPRRGMYRLRVEPLAEQPRTHKKLSKER
jgi:hypothetical protein